MDLLEQVATPGASHLTYDATTGVWHYNWQTTKHAEEHMREAGPEPDGRLRALQDRQVIGGRSAPQTGSGKTSAGGHHGRRPFATYEEGELINDG